ncbi:hypothetical protein U5922_006030 [Aquicoccus sp. G2-2]|jgi:hypothetical protein|uniref:hypothetical protein n=1 Tax=Aquicoccus sp. G2-2 TaxID=3092120 RepID=UPI002ADF9BD7|nr:hypothetical protein [Aquicoccus sp. G2-2]MEA1113049.1 hypothetical protein [Aquicoccus sp. G2-2]
MRKPILVLLLASMTLAACGSMRDSRINPFNWFGRSRAEAPATAENTNPLIPKRSNMFQRRAPGPYAGLTVDQVTALKIERAPGGAIVHVTGVAATQGSYDVKLVKEDSDRADTLVYTLKALVPPRQRVGTELSRELTAATFVTTNDLSGIRTIRVLGARNARSTSRR